MSCITPELAKLAEADVERMIKDFQYVQNEEDMAIESICQILRRKIRNMKKILDEADTTDMASYPILEKELRLQKARYRAALKLRNSC